MLRERTDINASETLVQEAHQFADPLKTIEDLDPLLERIGGAHGQLGGCAPPSRRGR